MTSNLLPCDVLINRLIQHDKNADPKAIHKAYDIAKKAHEGQLRASGEPYFSHPLAVAEILCDLKLDAATIMTALLHDAVEDTNITLADIKKNFGVTVMELVDGVTKLSKVKMRTNQTEQAENFRKLVIAMAKDLRVLLVKLVDRLHNMRTLHYIANVQKRVKKARETMEIYAPLAERIGLYKIKEELQELAFQHINPAARSSIVDRLQFLKDKNDSIIENIMLTLRTMLKQANLPGDVTGRTKAPYSIWCKMQRQKISFEEVSDIIAFRIIVDTRDDCYKALGMVHNEYNVITNKFKDYISTSKYNGYRSLHTTVNGANNLKIEIQIRSWEMHEFAERGIAAHWSYKQENLKNKTGSEINNYQWLRTLIEILESSDNPEEFLEYSKLEMFNDYIYCFSPKGDIINLPVGATVIDFAYAIHSNVGDHCAGAMIGGKLVPLRTKLNNGDEIEIITKDKQKPTSSWEKLAITGKATTNIRRFLRNQDRQKHMEQGQQLLHDRFKEEAIKINNSRINKICELMQISDSEELYCKIGLDQIKIHDIITQLYPQHKFNIARKEEAKKIKSKGRQELIIDSSDGTIVNPNAINGIDKDIVVHFPKCCHPLPGDAIIGIVHTGKGINIHTQDCEVLNNYVPDPNRWLNVSWNKQEDNSHKFVGRIELTLQNKPGMLANISMLIYQQDGNITNLKVIGKNEDFFELLLDLEVRNTQHLMDILTTMRSSPEVNNVNRVK